MESLLEKVISLDYRIKGGGNRFKNTEEHSSLVLDIQEQTWYWNSKNLSGKPIDYLILVKRLTREQAVELINDLSGISSTVLTPRQTVSVPNEKLVKIFWENGKTDRDYWYRRGLTDSTIDLFRLGKYDGLYTLPIYYKDKFMNFQCRKDIPKKVILPWYKGVGPLLFNSNILSLLTTVFITEGPVDAILLSQLGFPAVSHTAGANGWQDSWFTDFARIQKVYYVADNDMAGIIAARTVAKCLGVHRVKIIQFETDVEKYDAVDFFRDGHTVDEFKHLIDRSKFLFEINPKQFRGASCGKPKC